MAVSLYQAGMSGLMASQQQLATTGHNIANVNTDGYSRQRAEQNAAIGLNDGSNYVGGGTYVQDITRLYDKFAYKEQVINQSNLGNANSLEMNLSHLDQLMSNSGDAVMGSLNTFYQAINSVADNPNDSGLRSIMLSQANTLSNDFNELTNDFDNITKNINGEIDQIANNISKISQEIAKINDAIMQTQSQDGGQPNDLLDKRDQMINELSGYTSVNTVEDANGVMTVMIGQGTTLVAGITPMTLNVNAGDPDPFKTELRLSTGSSTVAINSDKLGGALAASFEFRDEHLSQTRKEIDRLAMAISSTLNDSQANGLDLNALQGTNIFRDINTNQLQEGRVLTPVSNAGTTQAQLAINDVSLVTTDELEVRFDGTDFTLINLTTGSSENLGPPGSGVPAGTHTPTSPDYGFSFIETGVPVAGDTFTLEPTKNSAAFMAVTLSDGDSIAASTAIEVSPEPNNVSDGQVEIINVLDPIAARNMVTAPANLGLLVDVYESAPGTFSYRVYDADPSSLPPTPPSVVGVITSGTFAAGSTAVIDLPTVSPAFQIEISGQPTGQGPLAPEKFTIGDAFGVGNSGNAVDMASTRELGVTNGGTETFTKSLAVSTSLVGSKASNSTLTAQTAEALFTQAYNRNQATSGVNLDEEAANLMKFQQAYQASSKIITVANTIFDTILSAVR